MDFNEIDNGTDNADRDLRDFNGSYVYIYTHRGFHRIVMWKGNGFRRNMIYGIYFDYVIVMGM